MIVNKCSENLLKKSKKLYENYRDNCTVVQRMLEKYKKIYPNISDYSIMHFIDIAEFCDLIMDRQKLEDLNGDECYCLLMAALFAHTGFGLNQEIMNRYINRLGIQKQTQSLTFLQIMSKYHVLFSACLIEEYGDIFEFPSEKHKYAITSMLYFIGGNSDDINQLEEILVLDNKNTVRLKDLAAVLVVGNQLAELKNTNLDLNYEDFDKYNSEEIVGFVERNKESNITEYKDVIDSVNNRTFTYKVKAYDYSLNKSSEFELGTVKVTHDGSLAKKDWTFDTNTISPDDTVHENTGHGHNEDGSINNIKDVTLAE